MQILWQFCFFGLRLEQNFHPKISSVAVGTYGLDIPVWLQWEGWGECRSDTGGRCGFGSRIRLRQCSIFSNNQFGKTEKLLIDECEGDHAEKELCNSGIDDCTDIQSLTKEKMVLSSNGAKNVTFLTDNSLCTDFSECCLTNPPMAMESWIAVEMGGRKAMFENV